MSPIYDFKSLSYDASKAALNSFTIHLAHELKNTKIKVNSALGENKHGHGRRADGELRRAEHIEMGRARGQIPRRIEVRLRKLEGEPQP